MTPLSYQIFRSLALPGAALLAEEQLAPIRDTFGALFFFATGMVISPAFLASHFLEVVLLALAALLLKLAVSAPLIRVFGYEWELALRCAAGISHVSWPLQDMCLFIRGLCTNQYDYGH